MSDDPAAYQPDPLDVRNFKVDGKFAATVLRKIGERQDETDPRKPDTASGKDYRAFDALQYMGDLASTLTGWAINHQTGLALQGLAYVPMQPSGTITHPEYISAWHAVDDHKHEIAGARANRAFDRDPSTVDVKVARQLLINLLHANLGGFPEWLCRMTIEALEGLDYGTTAPLFERAKGGKKRDYVELKLQLRAIGFVHFLSGQGFSLEQAREQIGNDLKIAADTLRTWEGRISAAFGSLELARTKSFAENAASWMRTDHEHRRKDALRDYGPDARARWRLEWSAALRRPQAG